MQVLPLKNINSIHCIVCISVCPGCKVLFTCPPRTQKRMPRTRGVIYLSHCVDWPVCCPFDSCGLGVPVEYFTTGNFFVPIFGTWSLTTCKARNETNILPRTHPGCRSAQVAQNAQKSNAQDVPRTRTHWKLQGRSGNGTKKITQRVCWGFLFTQFTHKWQKKQVHGWDQHRVYEKEMGEQKHFEVVATQPAGQAVVMWLPRTRQVPRMQKTRKWARRDKISNQMCWFSHKSVLPQVQKKEWTLITLDIFVLGSKKQLEKGKFKSAKPFIFSPTGNPFPSVLGRRRASWACPGQSRIV